MSTKIVEVDCVSKSYEISHNEHIDRRTVLNSVSFSLKRGENLGIIGSNGSGKSTLLRVISNIIKPDKGRVSIYGSSASILELGSGVVPEISGKDNIILGLLLKGYSRSDALKNIEQIVEFAELEKEINSPVKHYSNGMYLRLAFAIQTHIQPELLILDEVFNVGDKSFQEKCQNRISDLKNQGTSVMLVSHNLSELAKHTQRSLLIDNGHILAEGNTIDVIQKYELLAHEKGKKGKKTSKITQTRLEVI